MFEYLKTNDMYVCPHTGGFNHGVKTTYLGYIGKENPATANLQDLKTEIVQAMVNFWNDDNHWTPETRQTFRAEHPQAMNEPLQPFPASSCRKGQTFSHEKR